MVTPTIRKGTRADMLGVMQLIQELADYEKAGNEVAITVENLENDGFGEQPKFETFVADLQGEVIGFVLFFPYYSTWKGPCYKLEDFVVKEAHRKSGVGKLLFDRLVEEVQSRGAKRLDWQVLDWNEPAIQFYKKEQAAFSEEWIDCRLSFDK